MLNHPSRGAPPVTPIVLFAAHVALVRSEDYPQISEDLVKLEIETPFVIRFGTK